MAVNKKDKATTVSAASRTITADGVKIENGMFVDDEGNISERVAEFLLNPTDSFKVTIKFATNRLGFRMLCSDDLEFMLKLTGNPEVVRYLPGMITDEGMMRSWLSSVQPRLSSAQLLPSSVLWQA